MSLTTPSPVNFFFEKKVTLQNRGLLKDYLVSIFKKEKTRLEYVNFVFTSDKHVLEVNREYLNHDYYTDIITFELSPKGSPIQSDIYISIDRVKDNARQHAVTLKQELHRIIFHGVLHLCGYKDKSSKEAELIRQKEDHYLRYYFK